MVQTYTKGTDRRYGDTALLSIYWIMSSSSSIVILILFSGEFIIIIINEFHRDASLKENFRARVGIDYRVHQNQTAANIKVPISVLYCRMEACSLHKKSMDFVISSALRIIFGTKSQDIVAARREILAESTIASRRRKFWKKISVSENNLMQRICC